MKIEKHSQIDGDFEGSDVEVLFKLMDGSYWLQDAPKYWYYCDYCPEVLILTEGNQFYLQVEGQSELIAVREVFDVSESVIDGEFKGWDGETEYQLVNGQVWKQSAYKQEYRYSSRPNVAIYESSDGMKMSVAGSNAYVKRVS